MSCRHGSPVTFRSGGLSRARPAKGPGMWEELAILRAVPDDPRDPSLLEAVITSHRHPRQPGVVDVIQPGRAEGRQIVLPLTTEAGDHRCRQARRARLLGQPQKKDAVGVGCLCCRRCGDCSLNLWSLHDERRVSLGQGFL